MAMVVSLPLPPLEKLPDDAVGLLRHGAADGDRVTVQRRSHVLLQSHLIRIFGWHGAKWGERGGDSQQYIFALALGAIRGVVGEVAHRITYADTIPVDFGIDYQPLLDQATLEGWPVEKLKKYVETRNRIESDEQPVGMGWRLPMWKKVMENFSRYDVHVVLGGNQSSKSTFGARLALAVAGAIPAAEVYAFHISEKRSIDDQQRFIYEALPRSLKNLPTKKGIAHSLQYTQKNGFTDGIMILPPHPGYSRGGSIKFYNYAQYQQNDQIIEGVKGHLFLLDEKCPLKLMETLKYRLFTYHGRILLTYTVIDGWNDTIEKILAKTRTIEKRWCDHPKIKGYLPTIQESLSMESCCIYYFWTDDNPFTDPAKFWELNKNSDKATILARAFGIPTKSIQGAFPLYSDDYAPVGNVVKHEELPFVKEPDKYKVTRFMCADPGGSKNYVFVWVAIDRKGTWWVYDEWPDFDDWALSGNKDGPAQKSLGKGFKDYAELLRDKEGKFPPFERIIDPRAGAAERQAEEGATTPIGEFETQDITFIPAPGGSNTAGKTEIEDGIQLINDLLYYDQNKPRDGTNQPRLYISDRCVNMRFCMKDFTGKLGADESSKDFVDCLRYMRKANCIFIDETADKRPHPTGVY